MNCAEKTRDELIEMVESLQQQVKDLQDRQTESASLETLEEMRFTDVFDLDEIQRFQDAFADATGVASIITDVDGTPITKPSNFCRLCQDIIRQTDIGARNCMHSDAILGRPNPDGPILQPCLSGGLWDGGTSFYLGGRHVANWLIGQILAEDADEDRLLAYANKIGADEAEFREAMSDVTRMSLERFEQVGRVLYLFAQQLSRFAYHNARQRIEIQRREAAEREAAEQRELLRLVLDTSPNPVFVKNWSGEFVLANRALAEMYGTTVEDLLGKMDADFAASPEEAEYFRQNDLQVLESREEKLIPEEQVTDAQGNTHWLQTMKRPLIDATGEAYLLSISIDITEHRQAELERERLQREIIEAQQEALKELSTPIIPIMDHIIVMPLVGGIDSRRARDLMRALLEGISEHRAKIVILDVTGVPMMDTGVVNYINKTIQAARLKGAQTIVTGISDVVAESIVDLGIDWSAVETLSDLRTGLVVALDRMGIQLNIGS